MRTFTVDMHTAPQLSLCPTPLAVDVTMGCARYVILDRAEYSRMIRAKFEVSLAVSLIPVRVSQDSPVYPSGSRCAMASDILPEVGYTMLASTVEAR